MSDRELRILTFDIEEWFHILDNSSTKGSVEWQEFPSRIHENSERILTLLEKYNQKATFFCLGWIALKYPEVIKSIAKAGHEIGCHSKMHQLVYEQNPSEFKEDTKSAIFILEDLIGEKIISYRAPGFSITKKTNWAFEILIELGIERDSSIFPAIRSHGGYSSFSNAKPVLLETNGMTLKEFPINTISLLGCPFVYSGGGFFRIIPYSILNQLIKRNTYVMTYFHPRDFDPAQPMIPGLSLLRKFKSYVGLKSTFSKLSNWIENYEFIDLREADIQIDWDSLTTLLIQ